MEASDSFSQSDEEASGSFDISSALTQRKPASRKGKMPLAPRESETDDDTEFEDMIKNSISRRNTKDGTELLKNTKGKKKITKGEVGGGSFQSMGLFPWILRSLLLQGFRTPTPIQRLSIPVLLSNPPCDLVGMARTGSGKSLAFLIPLIQRLALILLPTRELALQILKVGKELARGWRDGEGLRWGLVVGGEGMDEQFEMISSNPDVIIATPGRLLHLAVEMNLDFRSVHYVVFDEADRLFEMDHPPPPATRQTLLFSATLPKSLVEFAKAGLQDPKLLRLDAESKISTDLRMAFFSVKQDEKDACLLVLLRDIIRVPPGADGSENQGQGGAAGSSHNAHEHFTAPHQTLVFAATKHHVEYLTTLLTAAGYTVSHIYGSLDQAARTRQMDQFRRGRANILVVTDVAARGIDIPILANVINYDFPQGARVFVHRVGRTARAGRPGWAWSFVGPTELPYLIELQLFLGRPLIRDVPNDDDASYTESLVLGALPRETLDDEVAYIRALDAEQHALPTLREVMRKAQGMYERSRGRASPATYSPARWGLVAAVDDERRRVLLAAVDSFRPAETALEIGSRGKNGNADLMKERRKALSRAIERMDTVRISRGDGGGASGSKNEDDTPGAQDVDMADEEDIDAVFGAPPSKLSKGKYRDSDFYMSYYQAGAKAEKGYSMRDGETFAEQAKHATFDLAGDEGVAAQKRARSKMTWSKKKKNFMVKTESGTKLPATYRSGRFDEWRNKARVSLPRIGEAEPEQEAGGGWSGRPIRKGRHSTKAPSRYRGKPIGRVHSELKTAEQIRKVRKLVDKRKAKNARPSRKGRR
ncbi:P-loop containing nucleoside triphosphate hydrolase protein [Lactifluus volemus]|nr:P-loop containing nucleoside triphosphate hydrolase protein [Lactifluus volemus]